jgi:hypothetical protein
MRRRPLAVWLLAAALTPVAPAVAQGPFGQPSGFTWEDPVLRRLWAVGMDSSQLPALAQTLLDSLGPRLTASPGMEAAQRWLLQIYQGWGIPARRERYGTWRGWRRGTTHIDLIAPRVRTLEGAMLAWSPGTPRGRPVRGPAVLLPDVADSTAFVAWLGAVRGKFVLTSLPQLTCRPDDSWDKWATKATADTIRARRQAAQRAWLERTRRTGYTGNALQRRLEAAGVAGIVTSNWTGGWGSTTVFGAATDRTPVISVACEDYGLLARLADRNQGPVIEVTAQSEALGEVPVFNVVAELRGTALPDEYVMLSAHFDSWDGGSGATDNGTGSLVMLEAMRLLTLVYPNPKRTIVVGHWSGEEQGLNGSAAFVADHPDIVTGLQALFNQDNGTGRVQTMSASGMPDAASSLARWLSRIPADITRDIKFSFPGSAGFGGTDHFSFVCAGAPGFGLTSEDWDYGRYTWHTTRDTYDKISFDDVRQNAVLTAMLVYLASEDTARVSRQRRTVFPPRPGGQPGGWPNCGEPDRQTPPLVPPPATR